jgi:ribonuclease P protein component
MAISANKPISLKKRSEFVAVNRNGVRFRTDTVIALGLARPDAGGPRIGYTATSAQVGNAVKRNRAKRRLRATAPEIVGGEIKGNADIVLLATAKTVTCDIEDLKKDLAKAISYLKGKLAL